MTYRIVAIPMTFSDLQTGGAKYIKDSLKCCRNVLVATRCPWLVNSVNVRLCVCASVQKILTEFLLDFRKSACTFYTLQRKLLITPFCFLRLTNEYRWTSWRVYSSDN